MKIFKIISKHTNSVYIGVTKDSLNRRLSYLRHCYNKYIEHPTDKGFKAYYELFFADGTSIVLIKVIDVDNREGASYFLDKYINKYPTCINNITEPSPEFERFLYPQEQESEVEQEAEVEQEQEQEQEQESEADSDAETTKADTDSESDERTCYKSLPDEVYEDFNRFLHPSSDNGINIKEEEDDDDEYF
jgi:hypothetical protein